MWRLSARPSARASARARPSRTRAPALVQQLRGVDLNHRPRGYEPRELPGCSTPRQVPRRSRECHSPIDGTLPCQPPPSRTAAVAHATAIHMADAHANARTRHAADSARAPAAASNPARCAKDVATLARAPPATPGNRWGSPPEASARKLQQARRNSAGQERRAGLVHAEELVSSRRQVTASGRTVLVVDDQGDTLSPVRMLLEREGHRVLT